MSHRGDISPEKPSEPAAAATFWLGKDGQFKVANHEFFERAEEHAEMLGESGITASVVYREDFIEKVSTE